MERALVRAVVVVVVEREVILFLKENIRQDDEAVLKRGKLRLR
jgi:hypothetical protein